MIQAKKQKQVICTDEELKKAKERGVFQKLDDDPKIALARQSDANTKTRRRVAALNGYWTPLSGESLKRYSSLFHKKKRKRGQQVDAPPTMKQRAIAISLKIKIPVSASRQSARALILAEIIKRRKARYRMRQRLKMLRKLHEKLKLENNS